MHSYQGASQEAYYEDEIELREIIQVIRKRIWLVIVIPLIAALTALSVSKLVIVPEYKATAKIALGTFGHDIYGDIAASREILLSRNLLSGIYSDLDLDDQHQSVEDFTKKISVEDIRNTRMLKIGYQDSDRQQAEKVVQTIVARFVELSDEAYIKKRTLLDQRIAELEENYNTAETTYRDSLATLESLEAVQSTDAEIALARARLFDHVAKSEGALMNLRSQIHSVKLSLVGFEKTRVIEQPMAGLEPVNVRPMLNTAIALVLGGMVALGLVFILEYFEKNPLQTV